MDEPWTPIITIHFKDKYLTTPQANLLQELVYQECLEKSANKLRLGSGDWLQD